ncbi:hypothetical protein [Persicobacter psychrovividus]|uniref:Uncharacterized protein n=1 Tax=Persicobacter psychrovividus TaxID=387638 RepID=A0ABM7VFB3_9BACT|nr:hypothetical protein PEPS_19270 [Persicobacter psychrovividus]
MIIKKSTCLLICLFICIDLFIAFELKVIQDVEMRQQDWHGTNQPIVRKGVAYWGHIAFTTIEGQITSLQSAMVDHFVDLFEFGEEQPATSSLQQKDTAVQQPATPPTVPAQTHQFPFVGRKNAAVD